MSRPKIQRGRQPSNMTRIVNAANRPKNATGGVKNFGARINRAASTLPLGRRTKAPKTSNRPRIGG